MHDTPFGVTVFILHPRWYEWTFYPEPVTGNQQFVDHGVGLCNAPEDRDSER
ncbi:MAG: hypothetical protein M3071_18400 [Actinomycetota bacterium]|nr:hypothetical protein [Actinomycetota bacterium]